MARSAQLIVVGKLQRVTGLPWFGGWRFSGEVKVEGVLWGRAEIGQALPYRFVCSCCSFWPRPRVEDLAGSSAIWFLDKQDDGGWRSAGTCSDPGYRPLTDLEDMRQFLRTRR